MNTKEALYNYCLRLGDNALVLSHRLSEWCSYGPFIEEDLALTNMALDLIGRAQAFLKYAGELEGKGKTEDDLAYRRSERQYYNYLLLEQPNGDFAFSMARQLFISAFEVYLFESLANSKDSTIAAIAAKTLKEVKYHLAHSADWVVRLGDGTEESKYRMQKAIDELWMFTGELFEMDETEQVLIAEGIAIDLNTIKPKWQNYISSTLENATLNMPKDAYMLSGSKKGLHTEYLGHILSEMQYLQRAYPNAKW
jgi:ring-1,2-phenylacetyl-CoA epoxidase subunit PaaC